MERGGWPQLSGPLQELARRSAMVASGYRSRQRQLRQQDRFHRSDASTILSHPVVAVIFHLPFDGNLRNSGRMNSQNVFLRWACTGVILTSISVRAHIGADEMAGAATKFLGALDSAEKAKAQFEFKSNERENWH